MSGLVDVVVFEIDGVRYGADLTQVIRLHALGGQSCVPSALGTPRTGGRALVIRDAEGGELLLEVDALHGVERVPVDSLRRLPGAAAAGALPIGAWLNGDSVVLLVDLTEAGALPVSAEG